MLAIRATHLFDGERFWSGPATVLTTGPTVLGIEHGHPDLPAGTDVLDLGALADSPVGEGAEVRGPVGGLLLLLTGRPAGLTNLTGPGADAIRTGHRAGTSQ